MNDKFVKKDQRNMEILTKIFSYFIKLFNPDYQN